MKYVQRLSGLLAALLIAVAAAGCGEADNPIDPSPIPPPTGPAELQTVDLRAGEGAELSAGQTIVVHYTLWRFDPNGTDFKGQQLESTRTLGQPLQRPLTTTSLIEGWVRGLPGMRVGGIRRLIIPPSLAYGSTGSQSIRPNEWIVFEIELLAIVA